MMLSTDLVTVLYDTMSRSRTVETSLVVAYYVST